MSQTKAATNATALAQQATLQATIDTNFIAQADQVIASQASQGLFMATLTLTKGVSAYNVLNYYKNLGYRILVPTFNGFGYSDGYGNYYPNEEGFGPDDYSLDQPADLFGYFYSQFFDNNGVDLQICDGKTPSYIYLSWA